MSAGCGADGSVVKGAAMDVGQAGRRAVMSGYDSEVLKNKHWRHFLCYGPGDWLHEGLDGDDAALMK
jgi:hypothetical protein